MLSQEFIELDLLPITISRIYIFITEIQSSLIRNYLKVKYVCQHPQHTEIASRKFHS